MYCKKEKQFSVNVRRLGILVHQLEACECELYDLLENLSTIFPTKKYQISFKRIPPVKDLEHTAATKASLHFIRCRTVNNLLSNN